MDVRKVLVSLPKRGILTSLLKRGVVPYAIAAVILIAGLTGVAAETGTFSGSATPTPAPSVASASSGDNQQIPGFPAAGGGDNIVQVINRTDGAFKTDGRVKLTQIPGPNVGPKNEAIAFSSCANCDTIAVALQIDLVNATARNVRPLNLGKAINYQCPHCATAAIAIQKLIPVADPTQVPEDAREEVRAMNAELRDLRADLSGGGYSFFQALTYIDTVIVPEFNKLAGSLDVSRDVETDPTTPGAAPLTSPSDSPSASTTPTASGAPTQSPTPSPEPTPSASP